MIEGGLIDKIVGALGKIEKFYTTIIKLRKNSLP